MAEDDFALQVGLLADLDDLEDQIEGGDFTADVDLEGGGAGGGGGVGLGGGRGRSGLLAGGAGFLAGGVVIGLLAGILSQIEPIQTLISVLVRQFELFLVPVLTLIAPILNQINQTIAETLAFLRDPLSLGAETVFEGAGRLSGQRRNAAGGFLDATVQNTLSNLFPGSGFGMAAGHLFESSDEAAKEKQGGILAGLLQRDLW